MEAGRIAAYLTVGVLTIAGLPILFVSADHELVVRLSGSLLDFVNRL